VSKYHITLTCSSLALPDTVYSFALIAIKQSHFDSPTCAVMKHRAGSIATNVLLTDNRSTAKS
jgi:hypothetical protein